MHCATSAAAAVKAITTTIALCMVLAACGGGDAAPPTPLPSSLTVAAPVGLQDLGTSVAFASNANASSSGLTFQWDFGDGASSALPNPSHSYQKPGVYTVRLTLSNEAGASTSATSTLSVANLAIVQGKACSGPGSAGWCWQRPLPQGNSILDYSFIDDTHGWAVGAAGTVVATTDGGATWSAQASGTSFNLRKVVFVDASVGWAAGINGVVLKTADAGASWQALSFGFNEFAISLGALDAQTAWVVTSAGRAHITRDGGSSWTSTGGPDGFARNLFVVDPSNIWALRYFSSSATLIAHSLDGGATWFDVSQPALDPGFSRQLEDLQFSSQYNGLLIAYESGFDAFYQFVSRRVAWTTGDGGATWQPTASPSMGATLYAGYGLMQDAAIFRAAPAASDRLQRSLDAGQSWQGVPLPFASAVSSYTAFSARRLIVTDDSGQVYLTTDAGAHWRIAGAGGIQSAGLNSVWFFDAREGVAYGNDGSSVRTTDGGQSWVTAAPPTFQGWQRVQFLADASVGWIISDSGTIFRSTDKGKTWLAPVAQTSALMFGLSDFHFIDAQHGWALSRYSFTGSSLFRTIDGGQSWQSIPGTSNLQAATSVRFTDAANGVIVGAPGIAMVTQDGGSTWSPRSSATDRSLRRVTFADASTAIAVGEGGAIVRSTDRGNTWTKVPNPTADTLNDVRFITASVGYAVGDQGTVLTTQDAGQTWKLLPVKTNLNLQAAFFTDPQTGWIAGDGGAILVTATGGR